METNELNTKEELIKENVVTDETPQEEVTEETTTELSNEEKLQQEVERLNDQVYRLSAEISNIQKRNAKERQDAAKYRSQSLAQNLLNVIDNLERAIASPSESEDAKNLKKGIEMVYESFLYALKEEGIEEIDALDQPFDPTLHHAVQTVPVEDGQEADKVVQVFQKGYKLKDRVLRPAMVIVSQ
ncbi:nucleotide exchange factor GrpE [uncultured Granulicatella sp.]|uniref:nucleotide exchange factor GrpE n=1 Tax=uncultured Granulicatella sp. TaxID=316089 RepID=UPI0025954F12|nr:nucleotide exchange factor GrpE [uncultured Granulicatella sp.]